MTRKAYTIQCGNCQRSFPIVVMTDPDNPDKKAPSSKEVTCPFCQTLLTVSLPHPLAPGGDLLLRGVVK